MRIKKTIVADWWQKYASENKIYKKVREKAEYKPAYLQCPADKSLKKKWNVCFWIFSEKQSKFVRKRISISGKTVEEREKLAEEIIIGVNQRLKEGVIFEPILAPISTIKRNYTLTEAIEHFLALKRKTLKARSAETYTSNSKTFLEFLELHKMKKLPLRTFKSEHAHAFTDWLLLEKKLSNKSHNKLKGFCSAVFNEFVRRKVIKDNPFSEIHVLPVTQGKHRVFNRAQILEFKQLCIDARDDGTWFFTCWIYYTFMRPHEEARLIRVGDIGEKTIVVRETIAKTSRIRHVYIPPPLEKMLQERNIRDYPPHFYIFSYSGIPGEKRVSDGYWYQQHVKYMKKMQLYGQDYDLYGWKHTGATALFKATKDLKLVQEQCGHSDIKQTVEYLRDLGVFYYEGQIEKFPAI